MDTDKLAKLRALVDESRYPTIRLETTVVRAMLDVVEAAAKLDPNYNWALTDALKALAEKVK